MKRKIWTWTLAALCLSAVLSGCKKENDWVLSLDGEKLYDTEVKTFGVIYAMDHNLTKSEQLDEIYEGKQTYEQYYKEQFSDSLIEDTILYAEAKKNKTRLSKEEQQKVEEQAQNLIGQYTQAWLEAKGITEDDVKDAYEKLAMGETYLQDQVSSDEAEKEDSGLQRYVRVYQVTFLTAQTNEDGTIVSDQNGQVQQISEEERREKRQEAEEFAQAAQNGSSMEDLLEKYEGVTGAERTLKYEDLSPAYQQAVDALQKNEVSGVIDSDYGYYVIRLLDEDDEEHSQKIDKYETDAQEKSAKQERIENWLETYAKDEREYRNEDAWNAISFADLLK